MSFSTKIRTAESDRTRLVHLLQRERGVTCGWVASGGGSEFDSLVPDQRDLSDEVDIDAQLQESAPRPYPPSHSLPA